MSPRFLARRIHKTGTERAKARLRRVAGMVGAAAVLGGCAERRLVAAPAERPGTGTWVAVWVAGGLAAVVAGVLLTLPVWRARRGSRLAAGVLALQAGGAAVVSVLLVGFAVRSWQLIDRPLEEPPATALVRISRIDGDTALFALFVLTTVLLGGLLVALLALGARLAATTDALQRWLAVGILALELGAAATLAALYAFGQSGWPFRSGLVALPIVAAALVAGWPRASD